MMQFFFDISDDDGIASDEEGLQLPSVERARKEAELTLGQIAKELAVVGSVTNRTLSILVRDDSKPLFTVSMFLNMQHTVH